MQPKLSQGSSAFSNTGNRKRNSLVAAFKDLGSVKYWLLSSEELLLEDMRLVHSCLQRCKVLAIYEFILVYFCLSFCLVESNAFTSRIGLVVRVSCITFRFLSFSRGNKIEKIEAKVTFDMFVAYLVNAFFGVLNPKKYVVDFFLLSIMNSFLPISVRTRFVAAFFVSCINLLVFSQSIGANYICMAFLLSCYLIAMSCYGDFMVKMFSTKLEQVQDKAETALRNKSMFVASISHDLKNPLNSLLGCLDLLKNSTHLSDKDKEFVTTASYSGQIMTYLIGNILDTSKIDAGKFDIDIAPMDILTEVSKVIHIEKELARKKGINLYERTLTPLPKLVYSDAIRFSQILINLIGNSIKFVSRGFVGVTLSWASSIAEARRKKSDDFLIPAEEYFSALDMDEFAARPAREEDCMESELQELPVPIHKIFKNYNTTPLMEGRMERLSRPDYSSNSYFYKVAPITRAQTARENATSDTSDKCGHSFQLSELSKNKEKIIIEDSGLLVIDIVDTGIGLSEEEQKRLFKPFNQANNSIKTKYGGTGLGLWITKQLVYLMSGFIELKSQQNKGTRFTITLPFKVVKDEEICARPFEESKASSFDKIDSLLVKKPSEIVRHIRANKKLIFTGSDKSLHGVKILLVEDEAETNEFLVEQVVRQLKNTTSKLFHSTLADSFSLLEKEKYTFSIIAVVASEQAHITVKNVLNIMKAVDEVRQIPMCVVAGKSVRERVEERSYKELEEEYRVKSFSFPLKDGELARELNKLRVKTL